ncbi:capsule biosynthesis protein CapZ [Streptomyces evansiae]|uniref:capsule biosynthesis protein CapZ n=1 Tax=Streptomyces evansiae TaxID=3075535 RepID=UPI002888D643|nr:capsule biosynthesis protein CapZ [Streptomyces sp. DSM 41859]MDT0425044.1 capsule biosynthesis protein CapZ [Streptomyces sp. DSM 41859]
MTTGAFGETGTGPAHGTGTTSPPPADLAALDRRLTRLETERARPPGARTLDEFLRPLREARAAWDVRRSVGRPEQKTVKVVRPSGITLPEDSPLRRVPPRKPEDQQPDYLEKFDSRTLFYDVFRLGEDVWLSGPPLNNLKEPLEKADWRVDGTDVAASVSLSDWGRTQRSRIRDAAPGERLALGLGDERFSAEIAPDESALFAGQRTLITKSQDNDLVWIQDFLQYYHLVHGVTGVVFYDNNSTRYTPQDVADAIAAVEGITTAVVVDWRYPWGPNCGPNEVWDSDYCQYGLLEHGRFRYLSRAAGVVSVDIDELVLCDDARSVFDHAEESAAGAVMFDGRWIAKATAEPMDPARQRRFTDYRHRAKGTTTVKWAVLPGVVDWRSTQWRVHSVAGSNAEKNDLIHHRHYQGVNNGWKYDRPEQLVTPGTHTFDVRMSHVLDVVFGPSEDFEPTAALAPSTAVEPSSEERTR